MARKIGSPLAKAATHDLLASLQSRSTSMTAAELRIMKVVTANPERAAASSITALAQAADVSEASVVRFCRSLGFTGYPEFRLALAADVGRRAAVDEDGALDGGITSGDSLAEVILKIGRSDARAIESTAANLDAKVVASVIRDIDKAQTIGVIGVGASAFVALDLQLKLNRLGKRCIAWSDAHMALTSVAALQRRDLLIAISHSGATADIVDVSAAFRERGVRIAIITNNERSAGAAIADAVLRTSALESELRSGATASRLAALMVVDCLCVGLAHRDVAGARSVLGPSRAAVQGRRTAGGDTRR